MSHPPKALAFKNNTDTINNGFFAVVSSTGGQYKQIDWLMQNVFCSNDDNTNPTIPTVGIAAGADPQGPQFVGVDQVTALFTALLVTTFPNANFYPVPKTSYCYSSSDGQKIDGNTIVVQARLDTDLLQQRWLPSTSTLNFYSLPLSEIDPDPKKQRKATVPACAVFTFNNSHQIQQLGVYMDRWFMADKLWPRNRAFPHPA
jgi:hypothetical protein